MKNNLIDNILLYLWMKYEQISRKISAQTGNVRANFGCSFPNYSLKRIYPTFHLSKAQLTPAAEF